MGLSAVAQVHIRSMRALVAKLDLFRCVPDSKSRLLLKRDPDEAYLTRIDGEQYALYFPHGGSVGLNLSGAKGVFTLQWLDISRCMWTGPQTIEAGRPAELMAPGKGHWVAVIKTSGAD